MFFFGVNIETDLPVLVCPILSTAVQGISLHCCLSISFMVELVYYFVNSNSIIFKNVSFFILRFSFSPVTDCIFHLIPLFHYFLLFT